MSVKNKIVIYSGRFQPFSRHHYEVLKNAQDVFGEENVFIATSNKVDENSPFSFDEKKQIITAYGVNPDKVVQVKSPYIAEEITSQYNPQETSVVFLLGEKDKDRISDGKYFKPFLENQDKLTGFDENGYYSVVSHVKIDINGRELNGSEARNILAANNINEDSKKEIFESIFGFFNEDIYSLVIQKLQETIDSYVITDDQLAEFFTEKDPNEIILEASTASNSEVDDGPATFHPNFTSYKEQNDAIAERLGFEVVNYIVGKDISFPLGREKKIVSVVAFGKVGVSNKSDNPVQKYKDHITKIATATGYEIVDFLGIDGNDVEGVAVEAPKQYTDTPAEASEDAESGTTAKELEDEMVVKENIIDELSSYLTEHITEEELPIDSFDIKDSLSPDIFTNEDILKPEIRKRLLVLAKKFFDDLGVDVKIDDITLTGSLANFNWSKFSDVDLHILVDYSKVDKDPEFVKDFFLSKKSLWNDKHTVNIHGFEVEIYVQDTKEAHHSTGVYSLIKDAWLVSPQKIERSIDKPAIKIKAEFFIREIDSIEKDLEEGKHEVVIQRGEALKDKIAKMRKCGLEKGGEFSTENLAFKALRRSGAIGRVNDLITTAYDDQMSISERLSNDLSTSLIEDTKILTNSGVVGHISHPFDEMDLTFGDLKELVKLSLSGKLENVTEKLDGQNIKVTWKEGKLRAARNKGHIKNHAAEALTIEGLEKHFNGRGPVKDTFVFAAEDLQNAIGQLSKADLKKYFKEGKRFMNLEVIWPGNPNIISYDKAYLVFHGIAEYNKDGEVTNYDKNITSEIAEKIEKKKANVQERFTIIKPNNLTLREINGISDIYLAKLNELQTKFKLTDESTLAFYHQNWWTNFINEISGKFSYSVPGNTMIGLVKRWAFGDKTYSLREIKNDIKENEQFLEWLDEFDKKYYKKQIKENFKPFEHIFFSIGSEVLQNITGFIAENPDEVINSIRTNLDNTIKSIHEGDNLDQIDKLSIQVNKLEEIGGMDKIAPLEGIVFEYKGKNLKLTGAFACSNQILGIIRYSR